MPPPLVSRKLIPFAQSSELPPPSATMESTRSGSANRTPDSIIVLSGFSPNS
jgi:hypothetical protein